MSFSINLGAWGSIFAVPCEVVNKHLKLVGEIQLKVLLFILNSNSSDLSFEKIADALNYNEFDVKDAIQYWIDNKLLKFENNTLIPSDEKRSDENHSKHINTAEKIKSPSRAPTRKQLPTNFDLAKRLNEAPEISYIIQEAQLILGRTVSNADAAKLLSLYDCDGLSPEVIVMLIQYAASMGKTGMAYIEKVGISWADEGINTIEAAENKIRKAKTMHDAFNKVQKLFGMTSHSPTSKELDFCQKWVHDWGFSDAMLREAYERNIDTIGKFSYNYTNGILSKWYNNGITSIKEVKESDIKNNRSIAQNKKTSQSKNTSFQNFESSATYDLDAFSKKSIFDD